MHMYNDWNRALSAKSSSTLLLLHLSLCCSKMHIRMYFVYECVVFCYGSRSRWLHPCACVWLWHACTCRSVWHHTHCGVVSCSGLLPNWVVPLFMRISLPSRALFPFFPPFPSHRLVPKGFCRITDALSRCRNKRQTMRSKNSWRRCSERR